MENQNYPEIQTEDEIQKDLQDLEDAGNRLRFANYIIDRIFATFFAVLILMLLIFIFPSAEYYFSTMSKGMDILITALLVLIYYFVIESATGGRSIGKYVTQTRVVDLMGNTPGTGIFLKRNLCRFIPFEPFSFLFSEEGWHDYFSDTRVVKIQKK